MSGATWRTGKGISAVSGATDEVIRCAYDILNALGVLSPSAALMALTSVLFGIEDRAKLYYISGGKSSGERPATDGGASDGGASDGGSSDSGGSGESGNSGYSGDSGGGTGGSSSSDGGSGDNGRGTPPPPQYEDE